VPRKTLVMLEVSKIADEWLLKVIHYDDFIRLVAQNPR
jgi:hypothetical protein